MGLEFSLPDFIAKGNSPEEIQDRMMGNLPPDIDDMPGGFPYDFTMPAAIEKSELIQYNLARTIMLMFPQYSWGDWLDLHGKQVRLFRHEPGYASGYVVIHGECGTEIPIHTVFCTPATDSSASIEFETDEDAVIDDSGVVKIPITALVSGMGSNVKEDTVIMTLKAMQGITSITNPEAITGGTERESDESYYERIALEYEAEGASYIGNDNDLIRWAKEVTGIGECIVMPTWQGPGTVKLALVDSNGMPANDKLVKEVYEHIVSDNDRSKRLLPTGSARLTIAPARTKIINFVCTGIEYDTSTDIEQIIKDFRESLTVTYRELKKKNLLIYNQIRPLITSIPGVIDFDTFLVNGGMENIVLAVDEYPYTGTVEFIAEVDMNES